MTSATLASALAPAISAALAAEFATEAAGSPDAFGVKISRLSAALATGIATALVPYIQTQAQVVDASGSPLGKVL
jgi:hypothetical protein